MVRLEGGGHQQVAPGRQGEALRHLAHVDVGAAPRLGRVVAEEVLPQVVLLVWGLETWGRRHGRRWVEEQAGVDV